MICAKPDCMCALVCAFWIHVKHFKLIKIVRQEVERKTHTPRTPTNETRVHICRLAPSTDSISNEVRLNFYAFYVFLLIQFVALMLLHSNHPAVVEMALLLVPRVKFVQCGFWIYFFFCCWKMSWTNSYGSRKYMTPLEMVKAIKIIPS